MAVRDLARYVTTLSTSGHCAVRQVKKTDPDGRSCFCSPASCTSCARTRSRTPALTHTNTGRGHTSRYQNRGAKRTNGAASGVDGRTVNCAVGDRDGKVHAVWLASECDLSWSLSIRLVALSRPKWQPLLRRAPPACSDLTRACRICFNRAVTGSRSAALTCPSRPVSGWQIQTLASLLCSRSTHGSITAGCCCEYTDGIYPFRIVRT